MPGLIAGDARNLAHDMLILGDDHAAVHSPKGVHRRLCHLPGGLAGRDKQRFAGTGAVILERAAHGLVGQYGGDALLDNLIGVVSQ